MRGSLIMKLKKTLPESTAPHWRAPHSTTSRLWQISIGLIPIFIASLIFDFRNSVRLTITSGGLGFIYKYFLAKAERQKKFSWDPDTLLVCAILSFLLPQDSSLIVIGTAVFFAIVIARECFGGCGGSIFHPALIGRAAILALFPHASSPQFLGGPSNFQSEIYSSLIEQISFQMAAWGMIAVLAGGIFLVYQSLVSWRIPVFFVLTIELASYFFGGSLRGSLAAISLFYAFFVTTDSTSPITSFGKIVFAAGSALLAVFFSRWISSGDAFTYSILIMNSLTPLIDRYLRPAIFNRGLA